jgi:hypothetical protein
MESVDLKKEHQITAIISGAMISVLLMYAIVVEIIKFQYQPFTGFAPGSLGKVREGLFAAALLMIIAVRVARKLILKKDPNDDVKKLITKLKAATIITSILCEVPAILGLVLFLMGGVSKDFYVLMLYSLALMVIYFPKYHYLQAWVRKGRKPY